jgi:hypothetical protein
LARAKSAARDLINYILKMLCWQWIFLSLLIRYSSFEITNTDVDIGARNSKVILIHLNFAIWIVFGLADGN